MHTASTLLDVGAEAELRSLLECRFPEVRRLAASALGKLAPRQPNEILVTEALVRVAEADDHPQVRQYALKALAMFLDSLSSEYYNHIYL